VFKNLAIIAALGIVAGCATPPGEEPSAAMYSEVYDPLEPMNRYFFDVNSALDAVAFRPIAQIYHEAVPVVVQDSVTNFLRNLSQPFDFVNNVAQGDLDGAGDNMGAFFTNTLLGVGGLFDVAQLDTDREDVGQTLAVWGVEEGPYLVIPVLGPNTSRSAGGLVAEYFIEPVNLLADRNGMENAGLYRIVAGGLDARSRSLETLDEIEKNSIDFYAAIRSLYRQQRGNLILDGDASAMPLPDISFEMEEDDKPRATEKVSQLFLEDDSSMETAN
jgi:phospholipid-binding lipoprotein MlaA